ncbi:hypothetical protein [Phenylobacterium sp.]|jgi:hypothetical protein|uniref:hypothetical protein n=1 Tax=Phenylobacterium sp. TaxID=1871053 RepID=UPI002F91CBAA
MANDRRPVSIGTYFHDTEDPQSPADVAVIMPTVLRPTLEAALESVFAQKDAGRIQLLVGVDKILGDPDRLKGPLSRKPDHVSAIALTLPFSTSVRHGGVHGATDGGSLRAVLSFIANSRYVAYLDDDNVWEPDHLASLLEAIQDKYWAHSLRMLVDEKSGEELGVDRWDAVGVGRGRFADQGGMVDPSCLMIDKVKASRPLGRWTEGPGVHSDRSVFRAIQDLPHGRVDRATVRYSVRRTNILLKFMETGQEFD